MAFALALYWVGFSFTTIREAGWRPSAVYGLATAFNTVAALAVAMLLFG